MRLGYFPLLILYLLLVVFLGLKFTSRMRNLEDFFLASRNLSARSVFLSLTASWFGATSILITTDEAFRAGLSAIWLVGMPAFLTVLILAFFLAGRIRRLPILTLPDLIDQHYGKAVRHIASFLLFWYMVILASSQMVAVGRFFQPFLGISYFWSLAIGTGVVLVYLVSGGLRSVAVTDSLQSFFLTTGLIGLTLFLLRFPTSKLEAATSLVRQAVPPGHLNLFSDLSRNFLIVLSFTLAWTISPIAWQRIQAARTERKARQGLLLSAAAFVFLYGLVVAIGILARPLFPSGVLASPLLSELISGKVGPLFGAFLFIAVAAAILSTMDTAINTGALTLTRDIYEQIFSRGRGSGNTSVVVARTATFLVALLSFSVATQFQSVLKTIGLASEAMAEGLFVPGMATFVLKKRLPLAGGLSLGLGGGFALVSFFGELSILPFRFPAWPYSVPYGVGVSLAGFALGWVGQRYFRLSRSS